MQVPFSDRRESKSSIIPCAFRIAAINGNRSHVPSPPRSGEKVAAGRMRGLTGLLSNEAEEKNVKFPLTLALSPRGRIVQLENRLRGERGQSQDTSSLIPDRVKIKIKIKNAYDGCECKDCVKDTLALTYAARFLSC